ncbi:ubiquinone biosynthesis protein [Escherichia coli]|uniref:Ubiquinone biosynthesis protein n=1 Tax=Escherichia coli TaxID=562 RepID=A0A376L5W8_ECOLX|nr:ubiquinone biosynthesis protein [Escherichia coli]
MLRRWEKNGTNMKLLAERGVQVFFTQVFRDSFFHADMPPWQHLRKL